MQLLESLKEWVEERDERRSRISKWMESMEKGVKDLEIGIENIVVGLELLGSTRDMEYVTVYGARETADSTKSRMGQSSNKKPVVAENMQQDLEDKLLEAVQIDATRVEDVYDIGDVYGGSLPFLIGSEEYMHDIDSGLPAKWIASPSLWSGSGSSQARRMSRGSSEHSSPEKKDTSQDGDPSSTCELESKDLQSKRRATPTKKEEEGASEAGVYDHLGAPSPKELSEPSDRPSFFARLAKEGLYSDEEASSSDSDVLSVDSGSQDVR